jgi:MFS family permease
MFRALRSRNFALLLYGSFAANIGIWMQTVAMGWLIYNLTSSASWLGRVGFAQSAPTLLFGLLGGALIEHMDRKRVLVLSALLFACGSFSLATLTLTGVVQIWMIMVISFVSGLGTSFFMPVFQALIPSLVPPEHLMNAISLNSVSFNVARVIGPLIAGGVMSSLGLGWCFALNGCGFLVMVASTLALDIPRREAGPRVPLGRALMAGLDYARRHPVIRALLVLCVTMSLFGFPYLVLMPALAREVLHLDASGFTFLFSAVGLGAVLGGLSLAKAGDVRRKGLLVLGFALAFGVMLIVLANTKTFLAAVCTLLLIGFAMIMSIASLNTLIQITVEEQMRARVMSMLTVSLFGLPTLGAWLLGALGDRVGIPLALSAGGGVVSVVALLILISSPDTREVGLRAPA